MAGATLFAIARKGGRNRVPAKAETGGAETEPAAETAAPEPQAALQATPDRAAANSEKLAERWTAPQAEQVRGAILGLQAAFGPRIERILGAGGGLMAVLDRVDEADDAIADELAEAVPIALVDPRTLKSLNRLGGASPVAEADTLFEAQGATKDAKEVQRMQCVFPKATLAFSEALRILAFAAGALVLSRDPPSRSPTVSTPAERLATYDDLLDLPENLVAEIINGRIETHPRPAPRHAWACSSIGDELVGPFSKSRGGPGGWIILVEPELHLADHVLVPDLAGWRRERMPALPETAWFEVAPDWACEILSPSTARVDRAEKMPIYAQQGVAHLWLIDPDLKTLEVYAREEAGRWVLLRTLQGEEEVRQPPFDAIAFDLGALWAT